MRFVRFYRACTMYKDNDEEKMTDDETKDLVDTIVGRFFTGQESAQEENTLKFEVVDKPNQVQVKTDKSQSTR